jgi:glycine oxidase
MDRADVAIVGGGVIGLAVAWRLAGAGVSVVVLERGQVGGQASGAAAGMLAPLAEAKEPGPLIELGVASLARYPEWVAALREETGLDPELTGPGLLRVARDEKEAFALRMSLSWKRRFGIPLEWLEREATLRLEPALSSTVSGALLSVREKHVEPRRLVRALALAAARRGVRIVEGTPVSGFVTEGARVTAVETPAGQYPCGQLLIAGGAWTEGIGRQLGARLPVFPVRGQIVALAALPSPVRHTIFSQAGYLVPKADGRLAIGSTEEHAGFDARPTAGGMARLLNMARTLVPATADLPFESAWAGLRPATADHRPILGPLRGWENAFVAAGHFRNGILLAPITGEMMAAGIHHGDWAQLPEPCRAARW